MITPDIIRLIKTKEDEIGGPCSIHVRDAEQIKHINMKTLREEQTYASAEGQQYNERYKNCV